MKYVTRHTKDCITRKCAGGHPCTCGAARLWTSFGRSRGHRVVGLIAGERRIQVQSSPTGSSIRVWVDGREIVGPSG